MVGCFCSILLWRLDRTAVIRRINKIVRSAIMNRVLLEFIYITLLLILMMALYNIRINEGYNFITAFLVIDISNTERKNLNLGENTHFYDSISIISRSLLCGFIAPLFFILTLGNSFAIMYAILFNLYCAYDTVIIKTIFITLSIIPCLITQLFLYVVYVFRNRKMYIDFKGDYVINCITRPLLNIDILGAYMESVNFYYHFHNREMHYIKSYGGYSSKIDDMCIKDYLSISYGICIIYFILFYLFSLIV